MFGRLGGAARSQPRGRRRRHRRGPLPQGGQQAPGDRVQSSGRHHDVPARRGAAAPTRRAGSARGDDRFRPGRAGRSRGRRPHVAARTRHEPASAWPPGSGPRVPGAAAPGGHDGVQLPVDVGELKQVGLAQLLQQISEDKGFGIADRHRRGVQDALPHGGLEPTTLPLQRGYRAAAVRGAVQAGGDIAQGGEVSHQVAVGGRAHRGDPEHRGPPAFAPFQEQPGVSPADRVAQHHARQLRAPSGGQRAQLGGAQRPQVQVEQGQAAVARGQHAPIAALRLAPDRLGQPAGTAGTRRAAVPGGRGGSQVAAGLIVPPLSQRQPAGKQVGVDRTRGIQLIQPRRHSPGRLQQAIRADPRLLRTGSAAGPAPLAPPTTGAAGGGTAARLRRCDSARG